MNVQSLGSVSLKDSLTPQTKPQHPDAPHAQLVAAPSKPDNISLSNRLSKGGERFLSGAVAGTKAAALPAMVATAVSIYDPMVPGLTALTGGAIGLFGAGVAGLAVGGAANLLGAGKTASTSGGALAGAAAGWALSKGASSKTKLMAAAAGALIGGLSGFAGSGAKLENTGSPINRIAGAYVGMAGGLGSALISGQAQNPVTGSLLVLGGAVAGFKAVGHLEQKNKAPEQASK